jgi:hypothetical protein
MERPSPMILGAFDFKLMTVALAEPWKEPKEPEQGYAKVVEELTA